MHLCTHTTLREPNPDGRDLHPTAARATRPLLGNRQLRPELLMQSLWISD